MTVIEQVKNPGYEMTARVYQSSGEWWWTIRVDGGVYADGEAATEAEATAKCKSALRALHSHDE